MTWLTSWGCSPCPLGRCAGAESAESTAKVSKIRSEYSAKVIPRPAEAAKVILESEEKIIRIPASDKSRFQAQLFKASAEFLFSSLSGHHYFALKTQNLPKIAMPSTWATFDNITGSLQSLNSLRSDPNAVLQWHRYEWPNFFFQRFPHSLDQREPKYRLERLEEFRYWLGQSRSLSNIETHACPYHAPLTPKSARLLDFDGFGDLPTSVVVHDGKIDSEHSDLTHSFEQKRFKIQNATKGSRISAPDAHGTHVAGLIAARIDGMGVSGLSGRPQLVGVPIEVLADRDRLSGQILLKDVLVGLTTIKDLLKEKDDKAGQTSSPQVIYLGYGFPMPSRNWLETETPLRDAIEILLRHNVVIVVPAGNMGTSSSQDFLPAAYTSHSLSKGKSRLGTLIAVGASDICSRPAWFSSTLGNSLGKKIFAPGERIYSTLPNGDFGFLSGTSQAAAQVAGILGFMSSRFPKLSAKQLADLLESSAKPFFESENAMVDAESFFFAARTLSENLIKN
jgi:subtilisin family serine protease